MSEFEVQDPNILSDHCLINFSFAFKSQQASSETEQCEQVLGKYVWNNDFKNEYINRLSSSEVTDKLRALNSKISSSATCAETQSCVSNLVKIIEDVSSPLFKKVKHDVDSEPLSNIRLNPWYNDECQERKKYFLQMLDKYRNLKNDENRINMVKARTNYKTIIRKYRYEYDREKTKKKFVIVNIKMQGYIGIC